jgi:hypothetical protein
MCPTVIHVCPTVIHASCSGLSDMHKTLKKAVPIEEIHSFYIREAGKMVN